MIASRAIPNDAGPKQPLRALIVEDSERDATLLLEELQRGFDVTHVRVDTADAMRAALADHAWDLIVSDYSMPAFSGPKALALLQETGLDIPLIIASGAIGEEAAVEALKAGASDFLVKGRLARLNPAVARELREAGERRRRRVAERVLEQTRERMQFALDAARIGIWEADLKSGTTTWSDVLEQLHGLPVGGFKGTFDAFIECIRPDDRQIVLDRIGEGRRTGQNTRLEYRTTWPDGSTHWITAIGRTFSDDGGEPIRAAGVGIDITAQKHLEEQFRRAQKLEAVGGLAAGIAHDFNNLLTVVNGYCELLMARLAADGPAIEDLNEIRRAVESAAGLTRQMLAFSRQQIVAPRVTDLNRILLGSYRMVRRLVEESVQIDFHLADHLQPINVDPGQMEQVLLNLVINARDAMPDGGVVTVETRDVVVDEPFPGTTLNLQPGPYVLWSVSDTGCGMSLEIQSHIFEPFFTTKARGRGTGLGLATAYGILEQSGGHIEVHSQPGMGTTFKIYLPAATTTDRSTAVEVKHDAPADLRGYETVLVVEDEAPLRTVAERILRRYGYTVLPAASGKDAQRISMNHRGPIHVVLTDVVMPGMSGSTLGAWMAQQRPDAKIIYVSGYADSAIARHGVLTPGTRFLQKPFSTETLLEAIREALS